MITDDSEKGLMRLVITILLPCFILSKVPGNPALQDPSVVALALGFGKNTLNDWNGDKSIILQRCRERECVEPKLLSDAAQFSNPIANDECQNHCSDADAQGQRND